MYNKDVERLLKQPYVIDGVITPQGDWKKIKGLKSVLYKKIINLLGIKAGTYMDHPELGTRIADFIGEDLTNDTLRALKNHIKEVITKFIPDVIVTDVIGEMSEKNKTIYIAVYMLVISTGEELNMGFTINMSVGVVAQFTLLN